MSVYWSPDVPQNFYGMTSGSTDNTITTEFESGKVRRRLKNSSPKKTFSVILDLWTQAELTAFWDWYSNVLLSRTQNVWLPDFSGINQYKEYRMTEEPSIEGQHPKMLTLTFAEV